MMNGREIVTVLGMALGGFLSLELFLYALLCFLRKDYPWLIMEADENPLFVRKDLEKFFRHGYDPELGWVRKPGTSGREKGRSGQVEYHINHVGARLNPGFEDKPAIISCYGDSFAFCRQVGDAETWPHYLSRLTDSNVLNFGVGNYGMDQALLRMKREYRNCPTKIVILAVVPETISRVLNVWKHYHEYGNIFGFKPRFVLEGGQLRLVPNVIDEEEKFFKVGEHLSHLRQYDYFYNRKFRADILRFPYTFSLLKTWRRNLVLVGRLLLKHVFRMLKVRPDYAEYVHDVSVLRRNIEICEHLYQDAEIETLMVKILEEFAGFAKAEGFSPVFVWLPQQNDIKIVQARGSYYSRFLERAREVLPVVDMTGEFCESDAAAGIYSSDRYGGHLSAHGNERVAERIAESLRQGSGCAVARGRA
ncbi:MAG: hypothetical protein HGA80_06125 [Candidatus Omnitrophica bacterium]|nr:hypothetical protein [Candidatus Omnitrophota bacterium]